MIWADASGRLGCLTLGNCCFLYILELSINQWLYADDVSGKKIVTELLLAIIP